LQGCSIDGIAYKHVDMPTTTPRGLTLVHAYSTFYACSCTAVDGYGMNALIIGTTGVITLHGDIRVQSPEVRSQMSYMSNIGKKKLLLLYTVLDSTVRI
jgi:hypothetical protein